MTNHSLRGSEGSLPRTPLLSSFVSAASVRYPSGDGGVPYIFLAFHFRMDSLIPGTYRVWKTFTFLFPALFARAKLKVQPPTTIGAQVEKSRGSENFSG